ncbi:fluoride efflux transporter CrcB [Chitinimonas arctica]|uniref:Fluoride-specific ion channel FluC n=1 Tax=Chitinimonas arctica TaxID=2594795 RepID=A0A516SE70_9NEIS|nr:fluoride efflux transporter CrcB [Chitinimonas arctica]QDQ26459.1 fluoride efflux transporter CrcB [Chitinimonas arctica]
MKSLLAVAIGGALGSVLRYLLANGFNLIFPAIPPGTLAANLIGAYLVGIALAYFGAHQELPPEWRLLVITGFLGGLTTFSSFSGEVVQLLRQDRLAMACASISLHLGGSLLLTFAGMATTSLLKSR